MVSCLVEAMRFPYIRIEPDARLGEVKSKAVAGLSLLILALLFPVFGVVNAAAHEKLLFAVDIIRHGDRTPLREFPAAPYVWPEGMEQLTAIGMRQEFDLGSKLRADYVDRERLLAPRYTAGTLAVFSTDYDRTLMSAQSFLMGLYPQGTGPSLPSGQPALPDAAQPIPIHALPAGMEFSIIYYTQPENYKDLLTRYVFSTPEWKTRNDALQPRFAHWSQVTGIEITKLYQLTSVWNVLYIRKLHHVPLPPGLSADDIRTIFDAGPWAFTERFRPAEIGKFVGHPLLKTIADEIRQASQANSPLKCVLIFAHDTTVMSQMSALGAPLKRTPPYAAHLHYALFDAGRQNFRIEVTYNDKPVAIPVCGGTSCTLTQFMALADQQ